MRDDRYTVETKGGQVIDTSNDLDVAKAKADAVEAEFNEVIFVFDEMSGARIVYQTGANAVYD